MSAKILTKALVGVLAFVCPILLITTTPATLERISGLELPFYRYENQNGLRTTTHQHDCTRPSFDFHFTDTDDATVDQPLCVHSRVIKPKMLSTNLGQTAVACDVVDDADDSAETLTVELLLSLRNGMFGGADDSGRDCNAFCVFNLVGTQPSHFRWSRLSRCWRRASGHDCMGATPSEINYAENLKASLCSISQSLLTADTVVNQHSYNDDVYITPTTNDGVSMSRTHIDSVRPVDSVVDEDPRRQRLIRPSPPMQIATLANTTLATTTLATTTLANTSLANTTLANTTLANTSLATTTLANTSLATTTLANTSLANTTLATTTLATTTVDGGIWTIAANVNTNTTKLSTTQQEDNVKTSYYLQRSKLW